MGGEPIGIGVVGLGNRGRSLALAWGRNPGCRIVACCERDPGVLRAAREELRDQSIAWHGDLGEMLRDPRVEAVIVATHDRHHAECAIPVLQARRHLFLEKPMAQSVEDCDAVIRAWEGSGTVFMVGLELRYCSLCRTMREILDRGDIGEVRLAYAVDNVSVGGTYYYHGPRRKREYTVSLILEKGTHTLDLMNWYIGSDPVRVYSESSLDVFGGQEPDTLRCRDCARAGSCPYSIAGPGAQVHGDGCVWAKEIDVEDNSVTTVRYANGAKLTYVECHFTPDYNRHFVLIGTKGRMVAFYNNEQEFRIELTYRHSDRRDLFSPPKLSGSHGGGDVAIHAEFLSLARAGKACCPGVMGARNSAAIAIRAAESSEVGESRHIEPYPRAPGLVYAP